MQPPACNDTLPPEPKERPDKDASFAAGARHTPSATGGKDDARGSAPGTRGVKNGR